MKRLFLLVVISTFALQAQITLVKDKAPVADILFSEQSKKAATALNDYLLKATGTKLPIIKDKPTRAVVTFSVVPEMDQEEFKVDFPDSSTIAISSGSDDGLKIAVWDFLERHLGIRWLFPGDVGEVIPTFTTLTIPSTPYKDSPSFFSRQFSGGKTAHPEWQDKMKAGRIRVAFHHNLHALFHPNDFAESHPEFYPILNDDKRFIPTPDPKSYKWQVGWQPCFTAPGLPEAAAEKIIAYFERTGKRTYSLGINDSNSHCTCPRCKAIVGDKHNFNGLRDYSPVFIPAANRIAELVSEKYPDCKLGFLAYSGILEPVPGLKLHKNLVPFMTFDRMMWLDKDKEAHGHALTNKWKELSNQLGWYDYIYGGAYDLPRVYFHHQAEYLRWGYAHGVRHHYAEYYPREDWHEGPKFYLAMKLLWNIDLDVDATLDEWYRLAVGEKAAPYLKEYYARLENFWTTRATQTSWFQEGHQYLNFHSARYLETYTMADLEKSEELMNKMMELADNKPRAQHIFDAFQTTKKAVLSAIKHHEGIKSIENREIPLIYSASYNDAAAAAKVSHWQRDYSHGKFTYDEKGGRDGSGAIVMEATGSNATPMCYLEYKNMDKPLKIKVRAWFKAEGLDKDSTISLSIKWLGIASKGANDVKPGWLSESYTTLKNIKNPKDGEWIQFQVLNATPDILPCKMAILLGVNNSTKGRVLVDDLQIFAE